MVLKRCCACTTLILSYDDDDDDAYRLKLVGLVQKSVVTYALFCIHQVNGMNTRNNPAIMTAL